jgi:hypothetical protein
VVDADLRAALRAELRDEVDAMAELSGLDLSSYLS